MRHEFTDHIESISEDGLVRFANKPGGYRVTRVPADVYETLRRALRSGQAVQVIFDPQRNLIEDALVRS